MAVIKLKDRLDINIMWRLIMNGKFQNCINDFDVIGNPHANKIIKDVLEIYLQEVCDTEWDIRNVYIEETSNIDIIEKVLNNTEEENFKTENEKIAYIKNIAYPYKIKSKTISKYLSIEWGKCLPKNWIDDNIPKGCN